MKTRFQFIVLLVLLGVSMAASQTPPKLDQAIGKEVGPIRSSAAYAEVLLRKTELQADLESLLGDYTEQNPKIIDIRFELAALAKDIDKMFAVRPSETGKLTAALGKLVLKKAGVETELARMLRSYAEDHPEVRRMRRKVEIYAAAIKEILG